VSEAESGASRTARLAWSAGHGGEALDESQARYRALFEQSPLGVFSFDRSLRLTDANLALSRILGVSRADLVGSHLNTLGDVSPLRRPERVLDGEPLYFEGPHAATRGAAEVEVAIWVTPVRDGQSNVTGGLGIVQDVTDRRSADRALARSEGNFRTLIENAPDAVGVFAEGGEHVYVNPKLATFLGYEREELLRKRVRDLIHPDDQAMFEERGERRDRGEPLPPAEYRLLHKDGRTLYAEIISMKVQFDAKPVVLCMMRDLSERKEMQLKLLQSDRLASVGMLAAGIAHEINNPLSYVMANLEVIARHALPEMLELAANDEERERILRVTEMVEEARGGAERMRRIVRHVKTFARGDDDPREAVDVGEVLDASLQLVAHELRQRVRLVREVAPVPKVEASESRLGQVFLNLLVNALQALKADGGEVRVKVFAAEDGFVVVEIVDSGEGISADALPRVFDPFFTTKPVGVGTGLGLFVCQGIVTSFGGTLAIESEVGKGTVARVRLRAADAEERRPARTSVGVDDSAS
jgi:PAS domain S-box-containing protein